jgi:hypothetical protein
MKLSDLYPGLQVLHARHGLGDVKVISEKSVEILFNEGRRTLSEAELGELKPAEAQVAIEGLEKPLREVISEVVDALADKLNLKGAGDEAIAPQMAPKWVGGKLVLYPKDASLATKEIELEVFFRKVVMVRDYLRVLEQKINSHPKLDDAERMELQYYITKVYGSLTTFNLMFREKEQTF